MKTILKYRADDGSEHNTESAAQERDALCAAVDTAMSPLAIPHDLQEHIERGKGWFQHDLATVHACREAILQICRDRGFAEHYPAFNQHGRDVHPLSIIGRILSDSDGPLDVAWRRFCRIDQQGREHQQCYFAYTAGPSDEHVCLNEVAAA
jgi:hypothetical protein